MEKALSNIPEFVLFGSVTLFYIASLLFVFLLFVSEVTENGWLALISFAIFLLVTSWQSNLEPVDHLTANLALIGYYVGIGFIHSLIRTFIYGKKRKPERIGVIEEQKKWNDKFNESDEESTTKIDLFDDTTKRKLKGNVFRWWFLWPISLLTWIFSDLLSDVWGVVYKTFKKLFESILNLGMK